MSHHWVYWGIIVVVFLQPEIRGQRYTSYYYDDPPEVQITAAAATNREIIAIQPTEIQNETSPTPSNLEMAEAVTTSYEDKNEDNLPLQDSDGVGRIVHLTMGKIQGYKMRVTNGREIDAFKGIPFAEPPVGELRFNAPLKKKGWDGVMQTISLQPTCMWMERQEGHLKPKVEGQEDCLYLNVYAPQQSAGLPVIVYIHGGGFQYGTGNSNGPSYLLQHDVILVTMNYRVNVFGFLSTASKSCSGNWGLKDQAMALEWVTENIGRFGGDPQKLTLMGHSAGAASVHFHMMSPHSKDSIKSAVALSGTAFNSWALHRGDKFRSLVKSLGRITLCSNHNDDDALIKCLRTRSAQNISDAAALAVLGEQEGFVPVVEGDWEGAFLTKTPQEYYDADEVAKVPFITTITSAELDVPIVGNMSNIANKAQKIPLLGDRILKNFLPILLAYNDGKVDDVNTTTEKILSFYGGMSYLKKNPKTLTQMATDRHFALGTRKALKNHLKIATTYSYYFSYNANETEGTDERQEDSEKPGVGHGGDLSFLFNRTDPEKNFRATSDNFAMSDFMQSVFVSFATFGEPLYSWKGNLYKVWTPVDSDEPVTFLQLDKGLQMSSIESFQTATSFWESLGIRDPY